MSSGRQASLGLVLIGVLTLGNASCHPADDRTDLLPPANFVPPPVQPLKPNPPGADRIGYGLGFYPPDILGDGRTWHWIARSGEIRLRNDGAKRRLRLLGSVPPGLPQTPNINITLDGHALDSFAESSFRREYVIPPEVMGVGRSVLLRLETSAVTRVPGDSRELGLSIEQLDWESVD